VVIKFSIFNIICGYLYLSVYTHCTHDEDDYVMLIEILFYFDTQKLKKCNA